MKDPEIIELRNKFLLGILISTIVIIPFFLFFYNRLTPKESKIMKKIETENSMLIFITKNDCGKCNTYKKVLNEKEIPYEVININKAANYEDILATLDIDKSDIEIPSLIYIETSHALAILADIQSEEEMLTFIRHHTEGIK